MKSRSFLTLFVHPHSTICWLNSSGGLSEQRTSKRLSSSSSFNNNKSNHRSTLPSISSSSSSTSTGPSALPKAARHDNRGPSERAWNELLRRVLVEGRSNIDGKPRPLMPILKNITRISGKSARDVLRYMSNQKYFAELDAVVRWMEKRGVLRYKKQHVDSKSDESEGGGDKSNEFGRVFSNEEFVLWTYLTRFESDSTVPLDAKDKATLLKRLDLVRAKHGPDAVPILYKRLITLFEEVRVSEDGDGETLPRVLFLNSNNILLRRAEGFPGPGRGGLPTHPQGQHSFSPLICLGWSTHSRNETWRYNS